MNKLETYLMAKKVNECTYMELRARQRIRIKYGLVDPKKYVAPPAARPKSTKGDNPGYRQKVITSRNSSVQYIKTIDGNGHTHLYRKGKTIKEL